MSFGDLYSIPAGTPQDPNLPPIDLPQVEAQPRPAPRTRVTVTPDDRSSAGVWGAMPEYEPPKVPRPTPNEAPAGVWSSMPEYDPEAAAAKKGYREVGTGEAFGREAAHSATFGLSPAIAGAISAGRSPEEDQASAEGYRSGHWPSAASELGSLITGLGKLGLEHLVPDVVHRASERYSRGREEAQATLEAGREQHPYASLAGGLAGSLATPLPGLGAAGLGGRIARGAGLGALGGGAYGAGSALSEGRDLGDIGRAGLVEGAIGGVTGGALHGAFGPRVRAPGTPTGEAAAATARGLSTPGNDVYLPRGVASDSRFVQDTTSKLRQVPLAGERIGHAVDTVQEAAGHRIGSIAGEMTGPAGDRAAADAIMRPSLQGVIDRNRAVIDANYNGVRGQIHLDSRFGLPRTRATLRDIRQNRAEAGWTNPSQGLEQFENVAAGTNFNGAQRARIDAREAGNALVPHPGYNAADYNQLTRAMTADLQAVVQHAARDQTPAGRTAARQAFDQAEREFGPLADRNRILHRLVNARGEGAIATLLGAAKEKGGNVALLTQLRGTMNRQDFSTIGGVLLNELGHNNATGQFSLAKFVTNWDKTSPRARAALFDPQHLRNIEDIVGMGRHIKGALRESSTSHSAGALVLFEVAKDAAALAHDLMSSGGLGAGTAIAGGATAGTWLLTHWLANPASASAMAAWSRARFAMMRETTPTRKAVFNIATRNLSHALGVPAADILKQHEESSDGTRLR